MRERDHLVREMMRALRPFRVADRNERLLQQLLQIRLPDVDDVVDVRGAAEHRVLTLAAGRARRPERSLRPLLKYPVMEILSKKPELPELVRDVLADIRHDAIRPDDDLLAFFFVGVRPGFGIRDPGFGVEILLNGHDPAPFESSLRL